MAEVILALGTNMGDRVKNLRQAVKLIQDELNTALSCSSIFETDPVGTADLSFLNAVASVQTHIDAISLIKKLKSIEERMGRNMDAPRWSNRLIDLDIITYDNQTIENELLKIPHPEYNKRLFVLTPLQEIKPNWKDPITQTPISEMILNAPQIGIYKTDVKW